MKSSRLIAVQRKPTALVAEQVAPATIGAVIVVNFGSSALLEQNLARVEVPEGSFIVVVDCFSDAAERARVASACTTHGWQAVLLDANVGFGAGVNAGADAAAQRGATVLVTLNPDAWIAASDLHVLIEAARANPRALVSPHIVTGDGRPWFSGADLYLDDGTTAGRVRREQFEGRPYREWATGACFAISAELWREVGGFDDDYFLYWEDIDLSHRILDAGGSLELLDVQAIHDEGQTHADAAVGRAKSPTYYYYNIRNRLLYAAKHLDDEGLARWMKSAGRVSYEILLQGGRQQLLTSTQPWRAYSRGLRDGKRMVRALRPKNSA